MLLRKTIIRVIAFKNANQNLQVRKVTSNFLLKLHYFSNPITQIQVNY